MGPRVFRSLVMGLVFALLVGAVGGGGAAASNPGRNGRLVYGGLVFDGGACGAWEEVFSMNPDGSDVRRLTFDGGECTWEDGEPYPAANSGPAWSPNGEAIAYLHWTIGGSEVRLMDPDGVPIGIITRAFDGLLGSPSWSPDGQRLALIAPSGFASGGVRWGVWVIGVDGSNPRLLLSEPEVPGLTLFYGGPEWSPAGDAIAFAAAATSGEGSTIHLIDPDGSDLRQIACGGTYAMHPEWSPNGQAIYCSSASTNSPPTSSNIWMTVLSGGSTHRVTALPRGARFPLASPDGTTLLFESINPADLWSLDLASNTETRIGNFATHGSLDWQPIPAVVDGMGSVGLVDPTSGEWRLRNEAGGVSQIYYGNPGDYPFVGDWDCDGFDTPGLYRQSDGYVYLRNSNTQGNANLTFFFGNPGDIPIAGDFSGDGCDTVSIYRPSEARFYVINQLGQNDGGLGAAAYSFLFGDAGDKPVVGDWDGDGIDEIGLHRESSGFFYYRNTLSTGIADGQFFFGDPGDRFVAGDWGVIDGRDTPGLFRPSNRTFYFRHTLTQGNADSQFTWYDAGTDWLPVAGDFGLR